MMENIEFGWRVPDFPVNGSDSAQFMQEIHNMLRQIQGKYQSAWVADHFVPWMDSQPVDTPTVECMTTVVYLAAMYPQLDFGTIVLCQSYRNPALLAKMAANLQWLTGGRFIFGIGAGWKADEYQAYGYDFPKAAVRIAQLEETVEIAKRMWRDPKASFAGKYYTIDNAVCEPKPDPIPPIMIGGGGEQLTLRVVAKHADWWNIPGRTLEEYANKLEVLRRHCDAVGRDYNDIRKTWDSERVAIARTEDEAKRIAAESPYLLGGDYLVGTPEQIAEKLRAYTSLGVDYFILRFCDYPNPDGALCFAEEVMPFVRS